MLRRFIIWRTQKNLVRSRYRMDRRIYRNGFGPGFFNTQQGTNFFEVDVNPWHKLKRGRRRILLLFIVLGTAAVTWFFVESMAFIELF